MLRASYTKYICPLCEGTLRDTLTTGSTLVWDIEGQMSLYNGAYMEP